MTVKVSIHQARDRFCELLDAAVASGEEYVVQRNGKDYAVIISAQEWRRQMLSRRLDALGTAYRLPRAKQVRVEALLAQDKQKRLTAAERQELQDLLRECDAILARRAAALDQLE
jgi:prevent-host-death family protein